MRCYYNLRLKLFLHEQGCYRTLGVDLVDGVALEVSHLHEACLVSEDDVLLCDDYFHARILVALQRTLGVVRDVPDAQLAIVERSQDYGIIHLSYVVDEAGEHLLGYSFQS